MALAAAIVDRPRDHLLPRAAFAQHQDRGSGMRKFFNLPADLTDCRRLPDESKRGVRTHRTHGFE